LGTVRRRSRLDVLIARTSGLPDMRRWRRLPSRVQLQQREACILPMAIEIVCHPYTSVEALLLHAVDGRMPAIRLESIAEIWPNPSGCMKS